MVLLLSVVFFTGCSSDSQTTATKTPAGEVSDYEKNDGDSCVF